MNKIKILLFFLGVLFLSNSCLKTDECGECFTPPPQLSFKVISAESGENLYADFTYIQNELKLYYIDNDDITYINVELHQYDDQVVISSTEMSWLAISDLGETFYLELNPDTTETIYLKIVSVFENCCTFHQIEELTINGIEPEIESFTNSILIKK